MFELSAIAAAFSNLVDPFTLLMLVMGIVLGLVIGILPGLGPPIAIALALPFTFYMDAIPSLILLLAIYNAAIYGGARINLWEAEIAGSLSSSVEEATLWLRRNRLYPLASRSHRRL